MRNLARIFFAAWYLSGWLVHVTFAVRNPSIYRRFGDTALVPLLNLRWRTTIMPNITFFALLLAVFEAVTGALILGKGMFVKTGLVMSILFNLFLVTLGLGDTQSTGLKSFLTNRFPNILFAVLQLPLLLLSFDRSISQELRALPDRVRKQHYTIIS